MDTYETFKKDLLKLIYKVDELDLSLPVVVREDVRRLRDLLFSLGFESIDELGFQDRDGERVFTVKGEAKIGLSLLGFDKEEYPHVYDYATTSLNELYVYLNSMLFLKTVSRDAGFGANYDIAEVDAPRTIDTNS